MILFSNKIKAKTYFNQESTFFLYKKIKIKHYNKYTFYKIEKVHIHKKTYNHFTQTNEKSFSTNILATIYTK